ncbi:MAG: hypothetical protein OEM52_04455 [bacterium]|nr:hypothetical protein [bacterium]
MRSWFWGIGCCLLCWQTVVSAPIRDVRLTVYTRDLLQYTETLIVDFRDGEQIVSFEPVLPGAFVSSLRIEPLRSLKELLPLSTRFVPSEFEIADLWKQYRGQWISFQQGNERVEGKILHISDNHLFLQPDTTLPRVELLDKNSFNWLSFDTLPVGAQGVSKLLWKVRSDGSRREPIRFSYLAPGANWRAAYHLWKIDANHAELQSDFSLENTSGTSLPDVQLTLVAGDVGLSTDQETNQKVGAAVTGKNASSNAWQGYQKFEIPQKVDIDAGSTLQLPYFPRTRIEGREQYVVEEATTQSAPVFTEFVFSLAKHSALGSKAMPWGEITVYGDTVNGGTFAGEDYLPAMPAGSEFAVRTGTAFSLRAHKERTHYRRLSRNESEESVRILVSNATTKTVPVILREMLFGSWQIVTATNSTGAIALQRSDATMAEWKIQVPAGGEEYLVYTVRYQR